MFTVLDIECTFQGKWASGASDPTAFNPDNRLVSVGYKTTTGESGYLIFSHKENTKEQLEANHKLLQDVLNRSTLVIGHNLKFDMIWLLESGFKYAGRLYDTMLFEYVKACGLKVDLSLEGTLLRYNLSPKLDILSVYCGKEGLNVDEVPLAALTEYGLADIEGTYSLFKAQCALLEQDALLASMKPILRLMNDFLEVLIDVERSGIKIDSAALDKVEEEFREQHQQLKVKLDAILVNVMGHTPINLESPEQISWVLHSIKVKDKSLWREIFNLGTEERNGVKKAKYTKRYNAKELRQILKENCTTLRRTRAEQCPSCRGTGYIQLTKKDGSPRKNQNVCHKCEKTGIIYHPTPEIAGFRIKPLSYEYAADGGFSSGKDALDALLESNISREAREFIEAYKQYNAISSYLSTFVEGIRKGIRASGLLHANFNQTVTATGRLSCTKPNLQNQPRDKTFPIRRVFVSRFEGGMLLNVDYAQLEFRVAAFNAQCKNAISDIINKVDVHTQTMNALKAGGEDIDRQDSKKYTFRPLFGGTSGTPAQLHYFEYFFKRYDGIFRWHGRLQEEALAKRHIVSPSGRIYAFPFAERRNNGSITFATQIKNYTVQGFATGDILPTTMIEVHRLMRQANAQSKLVLTVHDSIVADVHPAEKDLMINIFKTAFANTKDILKQRFNVDFNVPLEFDLDIGKNLLEKEKIKLDT